MQDEIKILITQSQTAIASQCVVARSFWQRAVGLLGKRSFPDGQGMLIPKCKSVHVWFMKFPIDVVFLKQKDSKKWVVSSIKECAEPWTLLPMTDWSADDVLELPAGAIHRTKLKPGDELCTA